MSPLAPTMGGVELDTLFISSITKKLPPIAEVLFLISFFTDSMVICGKIEPTETSPISLQSFGASLLVEYLTFCADSFNPEHEARSSTAVAINA
jgi:hypothetical protein